MSGRPFLLINLVDYFILYYFCGLLSNLMKKMTLIILLSLLWAMPACHNAEKQTISTEKIATDTVVCPTIYDTINVDSNMVVKENGFIVISKPEYLLYVCEAVDGDTVCRAYYPVCVGKNRGHKQKKGDMRTPESTFEKPFTITQITDASKWTHDFGDGRGEILSYGNWFMRLATPGFSGIGIHGSTNNESSVPGRGSEGCIRLRNADLDQLKARYAFVGMKVVILPDIIETSENQ